MNLNATRIKDDDDHDAFMENALRAADFATRNRTPMIIAVVVLLAIVVGTLAWRRAAEADKADAAVLMNRGLQALDAGDLAAAGPWFQRTIDEFSSTQAAGEAVYMLGAIALREGKFEEAESRFEETVHAGLESGFITAAAVSTFARGTSRVNSRT